MGLNELQGLHGAKQERVYPVVGPFTLTDHRLPAPNPPGWIVKTRSDPIPVARISNPESGPRGKQKTEMCVDLCLKRDWKVVHR